MGQRVKIAALAVFLTGCAAGTPGQVEPAKDSSVLSFQPSSLGSPLSLSQLVVGSYNDKEYRLRCEIELSGNRLVLVGLSEFGVTLFKIEQEGRGVEVETSGLQRVPFDPIYMLSDFYLVQWPPAQLTAAFAERGLHFEALPGERLRRVRDDRGTVVAEVFYPAPGDAPETLVRHYEHPYTLRIVTLGGGSAQ